jgi:phage gpG-like protein
MSKIAGFFPIGDTGEQFIVAEWIPDPEVIAQELFKLASDTEDWAVPLAKTRQLFIENTDLHFETETDPAGNKWTALDPVYLKRKLDDGWPADILTRTGALRAKATSEAAWLIEDRSIVFDEAVLPFYGGIHQAGTANAEATAVLDKLRRGQTITITEAGVALSGVGAGQNLPKRMFIGLDEFAILEAEEIFLNWLNGLVEQDISTSANEFRTAAGGFIGVRTDLPLFGGGTAIRGPGGRFIRGNG